MSLDPQVFKRFGEIAYARAGIVVRPGKEALVAARVSKRVRALRLDGPGAYLELLEADADGQEMTQFLDVMSTNYTRFFREPVHFDVFGKQVARLTSGGRRELKVWCAASSTGEEPYSLAMTALEASKHGSVVLRILATDISTRVLSAARKGVYEEAALEEVPLAYRSRYFRRVGGAKGRGMFEVVPELRGRVVFERLNLAQPPFPMRGPIDFIFCRNVMIYFDKPVRQGFVREAERLLAPSGVLFIGHAETLGGLDVGLIRLASSVYGKPPSAATQGRPSRFVGEEPLKLNGA